MTESMTMIDNSPPVDAGTVPGAPAHESFLALSGAELLELLPSAGQDRASLVSLLAGQLAAGRARARFILEGRQAGLACAEALSDSIDAILRALHVMAVDRLHPLANPTSGERMAIIAVGGYGRGTLAPGSDVDLLFLMPHKVTAWGESVVESMLYPLWDLRLKVGHSTRSISECMHEARNDMTVRTALLEARFVAGDRELFRELRQRFDEDIMRGTAAEFVEAKLGERDSRVGKAGLSRYLVEPNVKDGKGGLRDLNTLFWIAKYVYRVDDPRELIKVGLFTREEFQLFRTAEEFLWRTRCWMHFLTGRAEERLSFDLQRQVAARIGIAGRTGLSEVERFMKRYFLIAKDVGDLTAIVCAALEARHQKTRPTLQRLFGGFRQQRARAVGHPAFVMDGDRLAIRSADGFATDPVNLIRLYALAARHDLAIHPDTTRLVTRSLRLINPALRRDPEANRLFLELLTSKAAPEAALRRMNEAGVLGRFIPDFGRVVAMMQFNMYHHYTVDEHLLRSVGILAEIDAGRLEAEHPLANTIFPTITNRRALYVAMFLHDIAKGRPDDHSIVGAQVARKLGPRLGLTEAETDTVAWLVEHHLDMSMIAQSRDLGDPNTIRGFANTVQTLERLKLLLVLTVADIKAVGPGVWNGWKGELLRTLYYETEVVLTGGHSAIERRARVAAAQAQLATRLSDWPEQARTAYLARHYPAYWLKVEASRQEAHARFVRSVEIDGQTTATEAQTDRFRGVTELTVLAPDHPRLLAILTGACAAAGGNIVDAQIFTTTDGLALDTLFISRAFDHDEDELRRGTRIAQAIKSALKGEVKIADLVASRRAPPPRGGTFTVVPDVVIDNTQSQRHTLIEVSGLDRPGLLYDLTTALGKLNLNIASAHIVTFGEKAVDVFYVTDLAGGKIASPTRHATIRKVLLEMFGPGNEPVVPRDAA